MSDLPERMAGLPPHKRALFQRLIEDERARQAPATRHRGRRRLDAGLGVKPDCRRYYDAINRQLNESEFGEFSRFLNYGYIPNSNPQDARIALPEHYLSKNSVRLVLELIGECPMAGRRLLDVGCGRGGTVDVILDFFAAGSATGVDLSPEAVLFCRRTHRQRNVSFLEADAEALPFTGEAFDVVTNVESSHSYPNPAAFYDEVFRVLKPGGCFLYTDVLSAECMAASLSSLKKTGFLVERQRDITSNVLLSCEELAHSRAQVFKEPGDPGIAEFLALPGSAAYQDMQAGRDVYMLFCLAKPKDGG